MNFYHLFIFSFTVLLYQIYPSSKQFVRLVEKNSVETLKAQHAFHGPFNADISNACGVLLTFVPLFSLSVERGRPPVCCGRLQ